MPVCKASDLNIPRAHQTAVTLCRMWWLCFFPPWALLNIFALATFISSDKGSLLKERSNQKKNLISQPNCCILWLLLLIVRAPTWMWMSDARNWMAWVRIIDKVKMLRLRWAAHQRRQLHFCRVKRFCCGSDCEKSIYLKSKTFVSVNLYRPYCFDTYVSFFLLVIECNHSTISWTVKFAMLCKFVFLFFFSALNLSLGQFSTFTLKCHSGHQYQFSYRQWNTMTAVNRELNMLFGKWTSSW